MLQDKVVGEHFAGVGTEKLQNLKFVLGKVDLVLTHKDLVASDINGQILDLVFGFLGSRAHLQTVSAAQGGADAGQQLRHTERLDHIIISAHVQSLYLFRLPVPGGNDNDRTLLRQTAQLRQYLKSVHVRQTQIQKDKVGVVREEQAESFLAGTGRDGLIIVGTERAANKIADGTFVLDEKNTAFFSHCCFPP